MHFNFISYRYLDIFFIPLTALTALTALIFLDIISQVFICGCGLKLLTGRPVQFVKANDDVWSLLSVILLLEDTISFIKLNGRSHSAEEMASVLTAVIRGLMLSSNEEYESLYSRKSRTL